MEEKFIIGVIGGVMAGIIKDIPDVIFRYLFKITRITFWDYSGIIALGHFPRGSLEFVNSAFYEVVFSIFIGIVFVYIAPYFQTRRILLKGAIYGALVWFTIRSAVIAFQIKQLIDGDVISSTLNSLNSIFYGIILVIIVDQIEKNNLLGKIKSKKAETAMTLNVVADHPEELEKEAGLLIEAAEKGK